MLYAAEGAPGERISDENLGEILASAFEALGKRKNILAVPPDITRLHSKAGSITSTLHQFYGKALTGVLPALGTHRQMEPDEIKIMYPGVPEHLFRVHNWREDTETLGEIPSSDVKELSGGSVSYPWPVQVNRMITRGGHDLVVSIGQVVPHEVTGMANFTKNILIGTGGKEAIDRSHYLGAVYGIENILGRRDNPVRRVLNLASKRFLGNIPLIYVLTVVSNGESGEPFLTGLFIGDDEECFIRACELSAEVNITWLDASLEKVVVYLEPEEYKSTWLGNKAVYRTRKAICDDGELIILAPGVERFGEDARNDALIRKYGYKSSQEVQELVSRHRELEENLSAAAHLIHGSAEERFRVTWCPGGMSREEVESAGYQYSPLPAMIERYTPEKLAPGYNLLPTGEKIYFVRNPGLGLWQVKGQ